MALSEQEQNYILDHVLVNRAAWEAHALATLGPERAAEAKLAKAMRWQASYEAAASEAGYAPRSERQHCEPARLV